MIGEKVWLDIARVRPYFHEPQAGTSWSLTPQLGTVIIEVFSVKGLSLSRNPLRLHRAKRLPLMKWTNS